MADTVAFHLSTTEMSPCRSGCVASHQTHHQDDTKLFNEVCFNTGAVQYSSSTARLIAQGTPALQESTAYSCFNEFHWQ